MEKKPKKLKTEGRSLCEYINFINNYKSDDLFYKKTMKNKKKGRMRKESIDENKEKGNLNMAKKSIPLSQSIGNHKIYAHKTTSSIIFEGYLFNGKKREVENEVNKKVNSEIDKERLCLKEDDQVVKCFLCKIDFNINEESIERMIFHIKNCKGN